MKKKNNIYKGVIALLISQILIKIIGLAYKLYLTNKNGFGDSGNAIYSSGFQIYALLLTLSSTGVPNALSKLVSEKLVVGDVKGAHKIFKIAFVVFAFIGMSGCILLFFSAGFIAEALIQIPEAKYSLMALAPSIFFVSITSVIRGYFNGRENLSITAKSQTMEQVLKTAFTITMVEFVSKVISNDVVIMASTANLATTFATMFGFIHIYGYYLLNRKEIGKEIKQSVNSNVIRIRKCFKQILNVAIPISLSSLISSFNKNIDSFTIVRFLKEIVGEESAKIQYGILSGKVDILTMLPLCLNVPFVTALVPQISKTKITGKEEVVKKSKIFILISILIGIPCTFGMFVYAQPILNLLFPNAKNGTMLLKISSFCIIFNLLSQTINGILHGVGKERVPMIAFSIGMLIKLICNVILIKIIGISGAIVGNILCNMVVCIIGYVVLKKEIKLKCEIKDFILKPLLLTFFMIIISYIIYDNLKSIIWSKVATILSILVAIIVYTSGVFLLKIAPSSIFFIKK